MRIALLGDIALFGKMSMLGNNNWRDYFSEVSDVLSQMDYVVGNLETPFSVKKKKYGAKSAYICSDVENVEILKLLHVNAVTLANNHIFDFGREGYEVTKKTLIDNQIDWFGAEGKSLKKEFDNTKLVFEGFCCYSSNPLQCVPYRSYGINEFEVGEVKKLLFNYHKEGYLPIVAVHSGVEHVNYPSLDTIKVAHILAEDCDYIYYGHHPHVLQGLECFKDSLLAYSLGNFCFDDVYTSASHQPLIRLSENNRTSCILVVQIEGNKIVTQDIIPIYIGQDRLMLWHGTGKEDIIKYSTAIVSREDDKYETMRRQLISDYISGRKHDRNFFWYLKRLRFRYYRILKNARKNKVNYLRSVSKYIQ